jgi:hypothetical protein
MEGHDGVLQELCAGLESQQREIRNNRFVATVLWQFNDSLISLLLKVLELPLCTIFGCIVTPFPVESLIQMQATLREKFFKFSPTYIASLFD